MAWKNRKQRSLADSMLIDHDALKEPDDVQSAFTAKPVPIERSGAGKAVGARPVVPEFCGSGHRGAGS